MPDRHGSVQEFLDAQTDSRRIEVEALRALILGLSPEVIEHVKWNSPSYVYQGVDRITVNSHSPKAVRLILHAGATAPEDKGAAPALADESGLVAAGLLVWNSDIRATLSLADLDAIEQNRAAIVTLLTAWLAVGSSEVGSSEIGSSEVASSES